MKVTNIDGAILTPESIETIYRFQQAGIECHIELLEKMIDFLLNDDIPTELSDDKMRLSDIRDLRFLEQLLLTFKVPKK
ncbi:MAG: hypothetical protein GY706_01365 [Bacteroides sp.]|nr:hypothetical protein [Bacteroides sp.]